MSLGRASADLIRCQPVRSAHAWLARSRALWTTRTPLRNHLPCFASRSITCSRGMEGPALRSLTPCLRVPRPPLRRNSARSEEWHSHTSNAASLVGAGASVTARRRSAGDGAKRHGDGERGCKDRHPRLDLDRPAAPHRARLPLSAGESESGGCSGQAQGDTAQNQSSDATCGWPGRCGRACWLYADLFFGSHRLELRLHVVPPSSDGRSRTTSASASRTPCDLFDVPTRLSHTTAASQTHLSCPV